MTRSAKRQLGFGRLLNILLLVVLSLVTTVYAQEDDLRLQITQVDTAGFPLVQITLLATDAQSAPITDLAGLRLRENNIPVNFVADRVPVGIDVTFVLDVDEGFMSTDDAVSGELTRQAAVLASVNAFADNFMRPDGRDRVSVVVPDETGENGRYLIHHATDPTDLIAALEAYEPIPPAVTPFNEMMTLALDGLADEAANGRFQTLLLFSDGRWLDWQTDYLGLRTQANDANIPINVAILGRQMDAIEQENGERLSATTRGTVFHLPTGQETAALYADWQAQGFQWQLRYQSLQTVNGDYPLSVNMGQSRATATMTLALQPPLVTLETGGSVIRRVGAETTTPLYELQPTHHPISVQISWPDGIPRRIAHLQFLVNDQPEPGATLIDVSPDEAIVLDWDVTQREAGAYQLAVQVTDEVGRQSRSESYPMTIVAERPTVTYPTAVPTIPITAVPTRSWAQQATSPVGVAGIATLLLVVVVLGGWVIRRRRQTVPDAPPPPADTPEAPAETLPLASLIWLDGTEPPIQLDAPRFVFGRDPQQVDVVLTDMTVDAVHARISRHNGRYWLYDEGSVGGTFHNYTRLGLAPQELQDGDIVQVGKVGFKVRLGSSDYRNSESEQPITQ